MWELAAAICIGILVVGAYVLILGITFILIPELRDQQAEDRGRIQTLEERIPPIAEYEKLIDTLTKPTAAVEKALKENQ